MKILILNNLGEAKIKESTFLPRIGDRVSIFHSKKRCVVNSIYLWPDYKTYDQYTDEKVEAIISTELD